MITTESYGTHKTAPQAVHPYAFIKEGDPSAPRVLTKEQAEEEQAVARGLGSVSLEAVEIKEDK